MASTSKRNGANKVRQQAERLALVLGQLILPVYVRLVTVEGSQLVAVCAATLDEQAFSVRSASSGITTYPWTALVRLEAFKDAAGCPVFLWDFEEGRDLAQAHQEEEFRAQVEAATMITMQSAEAFDKSRGYGFNSKRESLPEPVAQTIEARWHDALAGAPEYLDMEISWDSPAYHLTGE